MTVLYDVLQPVLNLTHNEKVEYAKNYAVITGKILEASLVNAVLTDLDLIHIVKDVAEDLAHPARKKMLGLYIGLKGNHPFNYIKSSFTGQRALAQLDWIINEGLPQHAELFSQFKDLMIWRSNIITYPLVNTTLHDVLITLGDCPRKAASISQGFAVINTSADCPLHNPRLLALNPRTGLWQRINSFYNVSNAGAYEAQIPREWLGAQLAVDDAYGVI
jgi:hypothetical protein